jgi:hypothetical protein
MKCSDSCNNVVLNQLGKTAWNLLDTNSEEVLHSINSEFAWTVPGTLFVELGSLHLQKSWSESTLERWIETSGTGSRCWELHFMSLLSHPEQDDRYSPLVASSDVFKPLSRVTGSPWIVSSVLVSMSHSQRLGALLANLVACFQEKI